jgi:hypothetical protein
MGYVHCCFDPPLLDRTSTREYHEFPAMRLKHFEPGSVPALHFPLEKTLGFA